MRFVFTFQKPEVLRQLLWIAATAAAVFAATPGCSLLVVHPKKIVSIPAGVGAGIGGTIEAVPLMLMGDLGEYAAHKRLDFLAPSFFLATITGGPFWLTFGWWGLPEDADPEAASPKSLVVPLKPIGPFGMYTYSQYRLKPPNETQY